MGFSVKEKMPWRTTKSRGGGGNIAGPYHCGLYVDDVVIQRRAIGFEDEDGKEWISPEGALWTVLDRQGGFAKVWLSNGKGEMSQWDDSVEIFKTFGIDTRGHHYPSHQAR
jgi:hypothetical protein